MAIPEFEGWGGLAWRLADAVRRDGAWEAATVRGHQADLAPDAQNPAAVRIPAAGVSGNFFTIMGTRPALGRTFTFAEDATPTSRVAVLSDALWHRRWGGDSTILGRSIRINGEPTEVIGILPPGFHPPEALSMGRVDLYVPATVPVEGRDWDNYQRGYFRLVGRLAPGVTVAGLQTETRRIHDAIREDLADVQRGSIVVYPLRDVTLGDAHRTLLPLFAAVALLFVIACANVINLFLARATGRRRELALRTALGATRADLLRHLMLEGLVVALTGAALGLGLAVVGAAALKAWNPGDVPRLAEVAIDVRTVAFAAAVTVATGILIGAVSGLRTGGAGDGRSVLQDAGPLATAGRQTGRLRDGLVLGQTAIAVTLLVAAGLLINSFLRLASIDPGFVPDRLAVAEVLLGRAYATDPDRGLAFRRHVLATLAARPEVVSASVALGLPLDGFGGKGELPFTLEQAPDHDIQIGGLHWVGPRYFATMGIPVAPGGREFTSDDLGQRRVVMVNQSLVDAYATSGALVGQRIKMGPPDAPTPWYTIIGVAGDVRGGDLAAGQGPALYYPDAAGVFGPPLFVLAKTSGPAGSALPDLRGAIGDADPAVVVNRVEPMSDYVSRSLTSPRFYTLLLSVFAGAALLLAVVGIYGTLAYMVGQRTREMGIRIALGASPAAVRRLVVRHGLLLALGGIVVGLGLALGGARFLDRFLYGVGPVDLPTYAGVVVVLSLSALIAMQSPARRATRVDPVTALKVD